MKSFKVLITFQEFCTLQHYSIITETNWAQLASHMCLQSEHFSIYILLRTVNYTIFNKRRHCSQGIWTLANTWPMSGNSILTNVFGKNLFSLSRPSCMLH